MEAFNLGREGETSPTLTTLITGGSSRLDGLSEILTQPSASHNPTSSYGKGGER